MPPRASQIASSTKPPPAVTTQVINAAHFIETSPFDLSTCCRRDKQASHPFVSREPLVLPRRSAAA
jgi:hypothetical protein